MTGRGHWIAIVVVTLVFALAASADTLNRHREDPTESHTPAAASLPRLLSRESAETQVRAAAQRVLREIATTGRVPEGVPIAAVFPSGTEGVAEGIVNVARTPVEPWKRDEQPTCSCRATSAPATRTWTCNANVMRDVHHMLDMTFSVDDDGAHLERIQSVIGGW